MAFFCTQQSFAQSDTEFWFAAPAVTPGHENKPIVFRLSSYDKPAIVTISEPANPSFTPIVISLNSYSTYSQDLTTSIDLIESKPSGVVLSYGIKITATANISAYYEVGKTNNPEIFPLKGKSGKGNEFLIPSQTRYANQGTRVPPAQNGFVIVASENNTTVEITLSNPDALGHAANVPFTVTLQKGEVYAVKSASLAASLHLGGSYIKSDKPICVTIYDDSILIGSNYDLIGDQIVPIINTGTDFIIVRGAMSTSTFVNMDLYYVWPTEDGTDIYVDGATTPVATVNKGKYYEGFLAANNVFVKTSKPSYILHLTGMGQEAAATSLPSIKCTGSSEVSFVRSTSELFYLNIICKAVDVDNFKLNGVPGIIKSSLFSPVTGAPGWVAARINTAALSNLDALVPAGVTTSVSNSTGLFHLGFLNGGTGTGARLGYFSNYSRVAMEPNITTASCMGGNIQLAAKQLANVNYKWYGPHAFASTLYNPVITNASLLDSGYYYVEATLLGCGTSTDSIHITINPLPTIQLMKSADTLCLGDSKQIYFQLSGKSPWNVVFNDGIKNDTVKNVVNQYANYTAFPKVNTIYKIISIADSNACDLNATITDVRDTLVVNKLPIADFVYSNIHCEKNAIAFTDQSKADLDSISAWYWDMGNGDQKQFFSNVALTETYSSWGKDTVKLMVVSNMGCKSDTVKKIITINALPNVGFVLPKFCLADGLALFRDTTTTPDAATNISYLWNFNAGIPPIVNGPSFALGQDLQKNPSVAYHAEADYSVRLKVTNSNGCLDSLTKTFTINGAIPKSVFKVLKDTALCSNEILVIRDSSWVNFGAIGKLQINWGDGMDTIINDPNIGKQYAHLYSGAVAANQFAYTIKVDAYSGGKCFDDSLYIINLVAPPTGVEISSTKPYLCINDTLQLAPHVAGGAKPFVFDWSTNNSNARFTDSIIFGLQQGDVQVNIQLTDAKKCIYSYQNKLQLNLPQLPMASFIARDTVICNGDSVTLVGAGAPVYKWYNNNNLLSTNTVDSIRIGKAGLYTLVVNNGQCNSLMSQGLSILDYKIPSFSFTTNPFICINTALPINTNAVDQYKMHFAWDFGDTTFYGLANPNSHAYTSLGKYVMKLNVTNDYCPKYAYTLVGDTIQVVAPVAPSSFILFLLADQDSLLTPKRMDTGYTQFYWNPSTYLTNPYIATPHFKGQQSIEYLLTRINPVNACMVQDVYKMDVSTDVVVAIPKAFTPNGDHLNDMLKIEYGAGLKTFNSFKIFNRFGKIIFETHQLDQGWDGKYNGIQQDMDAYTYFVDYITYKDEHIQRTGSVLLMR